MAMRVGGVKKAEAMASEAVSSCSVFIMLAGLVGRGVARSALLSAINQFLGRIGCSSVPCDVLLLGLLRSRCRPLIW